LICSFDFSILILDFVLRTLSVGLAMKCEDVVFSGHAIRQMFSRGLTNQEVLAVIRDGQVVVDYTRDKPYPSCLILGFARGMPVHVVLAMDAQQRRGIVVTAYIPDARIWADDFKTRRTDK
jgi:hypothetical protein